MPLISKNRGQPSPSDLDDASTMLCRNREISFRSHSCGTSDPGGTHMHPGSQDELEGTSPESELLHAPERSRSGVPTPLSNAPSGRIDEFV